jgi:hypothetical protein
MRLGFALFKQIHAISCNFLLRFRSMPSADGRINLIDVGSPGSCAGCRHGAGAERCHGEWLDDGIGDGGASGEQSRWGGQAGGVDAPLVALHKITTTEDAGGLHLQCVRAAHNQGHQSSCLHRRNCVCSGMNSKISVTWFYVQFCNLWYVIIS